MEEVGAAITMQTRQAKIKDDTAEIMIDDDDSRKMKLLNTQ